eukprot:7506694-Ditylum_brightwellii.AAC.1
MSNLLRAQKKPLFGWYYEWLKPSDIEEPQQNIGAGTRHPNTIKVSWVQPDSNQTGGIRALTVSVVPNKGIFGAEYSLIYTIEEFRKKIVAHLDSTAADHLQRLHNLFGQCLQGAVATKWIAVLDKFPVATCTDITFKEAQKAYLEKIVEVTNLRDMLIRQLQNNGKLAHMKFNTYVACCQEWVCHLDSRYLNITIAMLTDQENVQAIFSHQPKRHQAKYTLEKEEVKNNLEKLSVFFNGCHTADEAGGIYTAVIKNQCDSKRACNRKESGKQSNCAKGANKHSSWSSNGNHRAM